MDASQLTQKQRDALPDSAFCGPNRTYPVLARSDIVGVSSTIGQAAQSAQADIKACVIAKAKRYGWTSAVPKAWLDEGN